MYRYLIPMSVLFLFGCAGPSPQVRNLASERLDCPDQSIKYVENEDGIGWYATCKGRTLNCIDHIDYLGGCDFVATPKGLK